MVKALEFNFSLSLSNEYSGLIFFRIDWLYLLAVQGTLKSLLPHRSSKASFLQHAAFFIVQLSVPFSSVTQSCRTLCNSMNRSMPGLSVHHQRPEFTQIHVHRVSDAIQPSHPLSSLLLLPSSPASGSFQMSQFFTSGGQSTGVSASASVLPGNIQG